MTGGRKIAYHLDCFFTSVLSQGMVELTRVILVAPTLTLHHLMLYPLN